MRIACLSALLLLLAGCGSKPGTKHVRIGVGGQSQLVYLPATLAQQMHFYDGEGLNVTLSDFPGGSKALEAMLGGSVDVVCGYFDHVIQMNAAGRHLKAFVAMQRLPGLVLVVSPQTKRKIGSIADLKGAVVGVSAPGSGTDLFLKYLLEKNQVPMDSVSVTGIGMAAGSVAAMERGKVDAAIMADPAISILARKSGMLRILADGRTEEGVKQIFGTEQYPAAVLYTTEEWLKNNPDTARALARAMMKTLQFMQKSSGDVATKMPVEFQGGDAAMYAQAVQKALPMYSVDGRMPADGPAMVKKVLSVSLPSVRDTNFDLASTYTNEWVEKATQ